jgi:hypothetical protein
LSFRRECAMDIRHLKIFILLAFTAVGSIAMADPPARVGRISYVEGDVVFRDTFSGESSAAQVNWPVTSQNLLITERNARTEIRVGSAAVRVDEDTELEVAQLDDEHVDLRVIYGSVYVRIKSSELARDFALFTPQGRVLLSEPSRIRVDAERAPDTTSISVLDGAAELASADSTYIVRAGKRAELADGDLRMTTLRPNDMQDDFDLWTVARDQRDDQSRSVRYVSPETTGYEDLDSYGYWETTSEYGAIWTPRTVSSDWAPYRVGRWTWVEPWGWTWVDSAPWGYAPFHYGRWVWFHQRWCWAPGTVVARPVWAPAMVGWVGGPNWSVSFSAGTAPAVGWFPLAPHEVYVPSYRVSPTYIRQINVTHVANVSNVAVVNGFASAPKNAHYRNREVRNAVSLLPHEQFIAHRTISVSTSAARVHAPRELNHAPVSAVMPASIAHPRFAREGDRIDHASPRYRAAPVQPGRVIQQMQPAIRESAPPTAHLPMPRQHNEPRSIHLPDRQPERHGAPPAAQPAAPAIQQNVPHLMGVPPASHPEVNRRSDRSDRSDNPSRRHVEPPGVLNPSREAPRTVAPVPQPNPAQDAARERAQHERDAQRHGEDRARALRDQQIREQQSRPAVPAPVQLKQSAPPPVIPGQEERRHHWQGNAPAEKRREERPDTQKDGNEARRRP